MSGYSKFANTKHKRERSDTTKDRVFIIIGREVAVAIKEGKVDPANNNKLRDVTVKVKANNMPNDTIDRGIKEAAGDANSVDYEALTYEKYGPNDVVIIVDTLTSNKNRMVANVRGALTKGGGSVGVPGGVSYMFDKKEQIITGKEKCGMDLDELTMFTLDAGTEDFSEEEDSYEVVTVPENPNTACEALEIQSIPMMQADVAMIPQTWAELTDEDDIKKLSRTLDLLDEGDDVQAVYHSQNE